MIGARRFVTALLTALLCPAALAAQVATCPDGEPMRGDLGIRRLLCVGPSAACEINVRGDDGALAHRFSVEPVIVSLSDAASRAGLREGDVLVAVDGRLVTTLAGGRYLRSLPVGQEVSLLLRREGQVLESTLTTEAGCGVQSLAVRIRGE